MLLTSLVNCAQEAANPISKLVPVRNNKLTQLLAPVCSGAWRISVIANLSSAEVCMQESLSTLYHAAFFNALKTNLYWTEYFHKDWPR